MGLIARIDEAVAARDLETVRWLLGEGQALDHTWGRSFGTDSLLERFRWMIERSAGLAYGNEPIAVLGPSLALARWRESSSGEAGDDLPIGPFEVGGTVLVEADSDARLTHVEVFAANHLDDAVVRLYERYAELLPDGPARDRAAATARSIAALAAQPDLERWGNSVFAPDIEWVDSRNVGTGIIRGAGAVLANVATLIDLTSEFTTRIDDVIDARPDALLVRWTNLGILGAGGGSFERDLCQLWLFAADGRLARWEQFDADRDTEALARFDEVTAPPAKPTRRVRPNAATASAARLDTAVAARDLDAVCALLADDMENLHHPTDTHYDREGALFSLRALAGARELHFEHVPLATLSDTFALFRCFSSFEELASDDMAPFGAVEREQLVLFEVDATGRQRVVEFFAADRLGDAVVRLYERHTELLPDGPERERAAATARSVAALLGPLDLARFATGIAPDIDVADHRRIGLVPSRGAEGWLRGLASLFEVADGIVNRVGDVLDLRPDALLVRLVNSGTDRVGGGAYERHFLWLTVLGPDGLATRIELFEPDREAEALARFDQLTVVAPESRFANAASRSVARFVRGWNERDWDGVMATFTPSHQMDDRRKLVRLRLSAEDTVARFRIAFDAGLTGQNELLATRGDRLALLRLVVTGTPEDAAPIALEFLWVVEVDASGRSDALVVFDGDDLDAAREALDVRYAAGESS